MAADHNAQPAEMPAVEMKAHQATYLKVIGMLKWGAVVCAIIALAVIWLISGK